jgi:predicted dehydrogenase
LKLIEVYRLLSGLDGTAPLYPDFHDAAKIARVIDAVLRAAGEGRWVAVAEV